MSARPLPPTSVCAAQDTARPCPVCASTGSQALAHLNLPQPSGSPLPAGYRLMACAECDLVFADTPAPQSAYDRYYQHCAKYGGPTGTGAGAGQHHADLSRLEQMAERLLAWLPHPQARVLDLGCGAGGLLAALQARGLSRLDGLDPDPAAVQAACARGLRVRQGLIHEAHRHGASERYDLIVLSHVAEHLRDLDGLPALEERLAPQGRIYIEVPDPSGYACGERPPYYYFDSEHINHFSARAVQRLLAPAGLALQQVRSLRLPLPGGGHYPVLTLVAGRGERCVPPPLPSTVPAVRRYLDDCARSTAPAPRPPLPTHGPVLAWGAGSWAQRLLGQGLLPRERLVAFLDKAPNKQGQQLDGLPILAPEQGLRAYPQAAILVCVAVDPQQIIADLEALAPGARQRLHFLSELS